VRKRRWRALAGLALAGLALFGGGVALFGGGTMRGYVAELAPRGMRAGIKDPYYPPVQSLTTLLRRPPVFEPGPNPPPLLQAPVVFGVVQAVVRAALLVGGLALLSGARGDAARERLDWGAFVALLYVLSTGTATYQFCAFIIAPVLLVDHLLRAGDRRRAWA